MPILGRAKIAYPSYLSRALDKTMHILIINTLLLLLLLLKLLLLIMPAHACNSGLLLIIITNKLRLGGRGIFTTKLFQTVEVAAR